MVVTPLLRVMTDRGASHSRERRARFPCTRTVGSTVVVVDHLELIEKIHATSCAAVVIFVDLLHRTYPRNYTLL